MAAKIRIKDIAEKTGVSVGTVDRVLHKRPNVSKDALIKVNKILEEIEYKPNMYASALACNKSFTFVLFIPHHTSEAYWQEIEEGANKAEDMRRDFNINLKYVYYKRFDDEDFERGANKCMSYAPDGVIIVPTGLDITRKLTDQLHEKHVPFVLLDSYMPDLRPLAFFGQDSFCSGYFAAKMLMLIASNEKKIMLMRQTHKGVLTTKQQANREVGFRHYMIDHFPNIDIVVLDLPTEGEKRKFHEILDQFFEKNPSIHHCITLNSKAHIIGEYLLAKNLRDKQIMGYDMVPKNAECLRQGSASFIIAQHGYQQGYSCVEALFKAVVLKQQIEPVNYMPIELLTKENCEFYRRTQM